MSQETENTYKMPEVGFLRLPDVLRFIPYKQAAWYAGVKSGRFPKPVRLGPRAVAWRVEDIRKLIEDLGRQADTV
jgi:predicted DNA-binding transcriptional regulator AlpA